MEKLLRRKKFEVQDEISNLERSAQRTLDAIERLKKSNTKTGFKPALMVKKYTDELEEFKKKIAQQQDILYSIENGTYEDTFRKELHQNSTQRAPSFVQKSPRNPKPPPPPPITKKSYSPHSPTYNSVNYEIRRYFRDCQSIPDYIEEKLDNLPADKGYIWRDIWCFGKLPKERDHALTMFEKQYNRMYIHEYDRIHRIYSLYEKNPQTGQRVLVEQYSTASE